MRVLILSNMYPSDQKPYSGIFVKNQVQWLEDCGADDITIDISAMRRRFTNRVGSILKYLRFLLSVLPRFFSPYEVVHLHFFTPLGILVWVYKSIHRHSRIVVTFHGNDVLGTNFTGWRKGFWRKISRCVDVAITVGPEIHEIVTQQLRCRRTVLIPAGIDDHVFYRQPEVDKRYDFVFVGSLIERKGIDLVLRFISDNPHKARWCIVGTGAHEPKVIELAEQGKVTYLNALHQSELRKVINQSKWLVIPSRKEPFGLVATESLFCGTPVICSDEPGLQMQVANDINGLIVRAGDYISLCNALQRAFFLPEHNYIRLARAAQRSNREFSRAAVTEKLLAIYRGEDSNSRKVESADE